MTATPFTEIPIVNRTSAFGNQLLSAVNDLQDAMNRLNNLSAKMNKMITDNGDGTNNYNQIELQFGITASPPLGGLTDTASAGHSLVGNLSAALSKLNDPAVTQMIAIVG